MSVEVANLEASLKADIAAFQRDFSAAMATTEKLEQSVGELSSAVSEMADAVNAGGAAAEEGFERAGAAAASSAISFGLAMRAARELARGISEAIDDANEMDPKGAVAWEQSFGRLRDAAKTLAGHLGQELRPALEWLMDKGVQALHFIERIDFVRLASDAKYAFAELKDDVVELGSWLLEWDLKIAKLLMTPFDLMKQYVAHAIADALENIATLADAAKEYTGLGSGGAGLRATATSVRAFGDASTVDQLTSGLEGLKDEIADMLKHGVKVLLDAPSSYLSAEAAPDLHFKKKGEGDKPIDGFKQVAKEHKEAVKELSDWQKEQDKADREEEKERAKAVAEYDKQQQKAMEETRRGDVDAVQKRDKKQGDAERDAAKAAKEHADALREAAKTIVDAQHAMGLGVASKAGVGDLVSAGMQGATAGGPMGAAAGVAIAVVERSKQFAEFSKTLGDVIQVVADTLGNWMTPFQIALQAIQALTPVIEAFGPVVAGVAMIAGTIFAGELAPLIVGLAAAQQSLEPLGRVIGPFKDSLSKVLGGFTANPLDALGDRVGKMVGYVGTGLERFAKAFDPMGAVVDDLAKLLNSEFGPSLNRLGNGLEMLGKLMMTAVRPTIDALVSTLAPVVDTLGGPLNDGIADLWDAVRDVGVGFLRAAAGLDSVIADVVQGFETVIFEIKSHLGGLLGDDANQALEDQLNNLGTAYTTFSDASTKASDGADTLSKATFGTLDPLSHFNKALNDATESLQNVPNGYKVAFEAFQSMAPGGGGLGVMTAVQGQADQAEDQANNLLDNLFAAKRQMGNPFSGGGGGGQVFENCTFLVEGVKDADGLLRALQRGNMVRTGSYARPFGSPLLTLGGG